MTSVIPYTGVVSSNSSGSVLTITFSAYVGGIVPLTDGLVVLDRFYYYINGVANLYTFNGDQSLLTPPSSNQISVNISPSVILYPASMIKSVVLSPGYATFTLFPSSNGSMVSGAGLQINVSSLVGFTGNRNVYSGGTGTFVLATTVTSPPQITGSSSICTLSGSYAITSFTVSVPNATVTFPGSETVVVGTFVQIFNTPGLASSASFKVTASSSGSVTFATVLTASPTLSSAGTSLVQITTSLGQVYNYVTPPTVRVTNAVWTAGTPPTTVFSITATNGNSLFTAPFSPGTNIKVSGVSPAGYDGTFLVAASSSTAITTNSISTNPGTFTLAGTAKGTPAVGAENIWALVSQSNPPGLSPYVQFFFSNDGTTPLWSGAGPFVVGQQAIVSCSVTYLFTTYSYSTTYIVQHVNQAYNGYNVLVSNQGWVVMNNPLANNGILYQTVNTGSYAIPGGAVANGAAWGVTTSQSLSNKLTTTGANYALNSGVAETISNDGTINFFGRVVGYSFSSQETVWPDTGETVTMTQYTPSVSVFNGSTARTLQLPQASNLIAGAQYMVINNSSATISVEDWSGGVVASQGPGTVVYTLSDNTTSSGVWKNVSGIQTLTASAPSFLSTTVTGSANTNLAIGYSGIALPVANGGTGLGSVGSSGQVLTIVSGAPAWATPSAGTVTSVAASTTGAPFLSITGSPVTSSGTLAIGLSGNPLVINNNIQSNSFSSVSGQGAYFSWNRGGGTGTTSFGNQLGTGATGGWEWVAYNTSNVLTGVSMTLSQAGALSLALPLASSSGGTGLGSVGSAGQVLTIVSGAPAWATPSAPGTGTVTSVGLAVPPIFTVSGSPVTGSGTISINYSGAPLPVLNGGTGATTATGSGSVVLQTTPTVKGSIEIMNLIGSNNIVISAPSSGLASYTFALPASVGSAGQVLTSQAGSNMTWTTPAVGSVTSVALTVPSFLSITGSPVTSSGTLAIGLSGSALPVLNGGTGVTTSTGNGSVVLQANGTLYNYTIADSNSTSSSFALMIQGSTGIVYGTQQGMLEVTGGAGPNPGNMVSVYAPSQGSGNSISKMFGQSNTTGCSLYERFTFNTTTSLNTYTMSLIGEPPSFIIGTAGISITGGPLTLSTPLAYTSGGTGLATVGSSGQVLTIVSGAPAWATPSAPGTGTVTSVAASVPSFLSLTGSPITTSGTLAISYSGTALPVANGGTGATSSTGGGAVVLQNNPLMYNVVMTDTVASSSSTALNVYGNGGMTYSLAQGVMEITYPGGAPGNLLMMYASSLFSGSSVTRTFGRSVATNQCLVESFYYNSALSGALNTYTMTLYGAAASFVMGPAAFTITGGVSIVSGTLNAAQIYATVIDNTANTNGIWIGYNTSQGTSAQPVLRVYDNSTVRNILLEVVQAGTSSGTDYVNFYPGNTSYGGTTISRNVTYSSGGLPATNNIWWNQSGGQGETCFGNAFSTGTNKAFGFYNSSLTNLFSINSDGTAALLLSLTVGGSITVSNNIFAQLIRIGNNNAAGYNTAITSPTTVIPSSILYGLIQFFYGGTNLAVGSITTTGGVTAFNTTSDYRMKENVRPILSPSSIISKLSPCTFSMKHTGEVMDGFIAHELQEYVPYAVAGEKDGEQMQAVDYSKLTPLLTAAMQEQQVQIDILMERVRVLENKLV